MARKERIEADVEFRPKGLGELKAKWADFAGDLLEPMVMLAAGATKAQAAWAGMRGVFESRVLGPLGLVAGASIGFLATTKFLVGKWRELGMVASGALERMTLQFRPLLGSMDRARERVMALQDFAVKTPFEIDEIVEANKMLETLTQGALSNEKGMTLVGDAASVAGQAFSDVARMTGRLYDGLMSGRPVGEATMRLQEMGIISGTVRNQIESMQAANASGLEIWKVVEKQLERNKGAMEGQSKSLEGLQSTWNDTKRAMEGGFSDGFLEGEKAGVEASIKVMEAMTPVMQALGRETGAVENVWENLKLKVVESVTGWRGFGATVEWVIKGLVGLAAVMAGASTAAIAGFTVHVMKLIAGNKAAAQSAEHLARVESASIPAKMKLVTIKNALVAASRANAAGLKAEAGAHMGAAAAGMKNLVATNGFIGMVGVGRKVLMGLGFAVRFVGAQLRGMAVAMLANPLVWLAGAAYIATAAFSKWNQSVKEAKEKLEGYQRASAALDSGMKKQISEIRTMVDLRQAEAKILNELTKAYQDMDAAEPGPMKNEAQKRVSLLQGNLKNLPSSRGLEKSDTQLAREKSERDGQKQVREYERDAIAAKGPEDALKVAEMRMEESNRLRQNAIDLANEEAAIEERAAEARKLGVSQEAERQRLLKASAEASSRVAELAKQVTTHGAGSEVLVSDEKGNFRRRRADDELAKAEAKLALIEEKLQGIAETAEAARLGELLASSSELQQLHAKIETISNLEAAVAALNEAQNAVNQNTDADKKDSLEKELKAARELVAIQEKLKNQAGMGDVSPVELQSMKVRRDELEAKRLEDQNPMKTAEDAKARKDAELAVAQARLDAEAAVDALRLRGYEREEKLLEIERQKLEARRQADAIGSAEYDRQSALLAERRQAMEREGRERRAELAGALEIAKLRRAEDAARRAGDPDRAEKMRQAADAREDARVRVEAEREARDAKATPQERDAYVEARVMENRNAREEERRRDEQDRAMGRARAVSGQGGAIADIEAEALRKIGRTREARRREEDAARRQDELNRVDAAKSYREQGFTAEKADEMANRDVKIAQAERMMQRMNQGGGSIVASSLAAIGGGGNVAGTDPNTKYYERMVRLLEEIRNNSQNSITLDMEER